MTVRLSDDHVEHLDGLSRLSGLDRNEVVRRLILVRHTPDIADVRGHAEDPTGSSRTESARRASQAGTHRRRRQGGCKTRTCGGRANLGGASVFDRAARGARVIIEPKTWKPKGERAARPRFRGLVQYMLRGKGTERCTWFLAGNLEGLDRREDAETAIKVVEAYQRRNTRAKRDKTYHLVISLHPDDRSLSERELEQVVRRAVEAAGLDEHQYIAVRHSDQEHEHVHVAVNKIHPKTLKIHHPWKDIERFKALASELEQELGLHRVDRSERKRTHWTELRIATVRSDAWRREFRALGSNNNRRALDLGELADWQDLHARLAVYGVRLVPRGNGLVVADATRSTLRCKASALGRQWSKQQLTERFGPFTRGLSAKHVAEVQREPYQPKPLEPLRDDGLWHEYRRELTQTQRMRAQIREGVGSRIERARDAHHSRFALRHHAIQALPISGKDKQALYKALRAERAAAERALRFKIKAWRAAGPKLQTPTWKAFLAERAADGDLHAVRRLARNRSALGIQIRSSERNALPRNGQRTSRGTRVHDIGGGARIRESSGLLELVGNPRPEALAQLAGFAEKRFRGSRVRMLGSRAVKGQLEVLIRGRGLRIVAEREHER